MQTSTSLCIYQRMLEHTRPTTTQVPTTSTTRTSRSLADIVVARVDPDVALIHHYRSCVDNMGMNCYDFVVEVSMLKYKKQIIDTFSSAESDLEGQLPEG